MIDSLYIKTSDGFVKVNIGGGSGGGEVTRKVLVSSTRSEVLSTGTALTVPSHEVGNNRILVYLDGLLCTDFTDESVTTISFNDDIPADMEIVVIVD